MPLNSQTPIESSFILYDYPLDNSAFIEYTYDKQYKDDSEK